MPEESIKTATQLSWPTPDEVIQPIPSNRQEELWEEIGETLDEEILNTEVRLTELPRNLREHLAAITTTYTLIKIGRGFLLMPEQTQKLAKIIKLYFINQIPNVQELVTKIRVDLGIDEKKAHEIYNDGDFKHVLAPKSTPQEKTVSLETLAETPTEEVLHFKFEKGVAKAETLKPAEEGKPLMIHEEKPLTEGTTKPPTQKGFSLPFGLFKSRSAREEQAPVKARVEVPKEEKRVVHYSELRTPLTPLGGGEELINLEALTQMKPPTEKPPNITENNTTVTTEDKSLDAAQDKPKVEGNVVDLRKQ